MSRLINLGVGSGDQEWVCSISQTSPLFPNWLSSKGEEVEGEEEEEDEKEKEKMEGGNEGVGVIGSEKAGSLAGPVKLLV